MIYLISDSEKQYCKIGYTKKNPLQRLCTLQVGNPMKLSIISLIAGSTSFEKLIHKKFKKYYIRGEWFKYSKDIIEFFDSLPQLEIKKLKEDRKLPIKEHDLYLFSYLKKSYFSYFTISPKGVKRFCKDHSLEYKKFKNSIKALVDNNYLIEEEPNLYLVNKELNMAI